MTMKIRQIFIRSVTIHSELCSNVCYYPAWRLCRDVILRPKPKNLGLIPHRFYEILHFVQNDKFTVQAITTQPPSRAMTETENLKQLLISLKINCIIIFDKQL